MPQSQQPPPQPPQDAHECPLIPDIRHLSVRVEEIHFNHKRLRRRVRNMAQQFKDAQEANKRFQEEALTWTKLGMKVLGTVGAIGAILGALNAWLTVQNHLH